MTLIDRHEKCIGLRLWQGSKKFVELWYCPPNYEVKPHSHNDQHIELMYICGKTEFHRETVIIPDKLPGEAFSRMSYTKEVFAPKWKHIFKKFTVKPGQVHWFKVSNWPLVFINFATFTDGKKPTSAAIDFHPTK